MSFLEILPSKPPQTDDSNSSFSVIFNVHPYAPENRQNFCFYKGHHTCWERVIGEAATSFSKKIMTWCYNIYIIHLGLHFNNLRAAKDQIHFMMSLYVTQNWNRVFLFHLTIWLDSQFVFSCNLGICFSKWKVRVKLYVLMTLWMWAGRHYVLVNVNKTRDRERTALWQDVDVTWMSTLTKCYCYYNYFIMISTAVTKKKNIPNMG